jgi:deoxyguanosine kinase
MAGDEKITIGLGANLGDREGNLRKAAELLAAHPSVRGWRMSRLYETKALSPEAQPDYLNAAAQFETDLEPQALLEFLESVESRFGRKDKGRRQPRPLDLDILLYGDRVIDESSLTIPHRQLHLRSFALRGVCELSPERIHPVLKRTMRELFSRLCGGDYFPDESRPQLVSIAGLIGVGKSTLAERLASALPACLIREEYDKNPFLDKVYEGEKNLALDSELYFLSSSASQLRLECLEPGQTYVSDYVFEKAPVYASAWLPPPEIKEYHKIYETVKSQVWPPVLVIYIIDSIENCLTRIRRRQRPYEQGIEPSFLAHLEAGYDILFSSWRLCPVIRLRAQDCERPEQIPDLAREYSCYLARHNRWIS